MWTQREIENYLVTPASLHAFAKDDAEDATLFAQRNEQVFQECIDELLKALEIANRPDPWGPDIKVTDDFLDPLFKNYYQKINLPQKTFKRDYHRLANVIDLDRLDSEVSQMLDAIHEVAQQATPEQ